MRIAPEIRFARATGSTIAYMVYGDGPVTICAVPPMAANIELAWNSPVIRRMFERYATFSRQVAFDQRGSGMSDRSLRSSTVMMPPRSRGVEGKPVLDTVREGRHPVRTRGR